MTNERHLLTNWEALLLSETLSVWVRYSHWFQFVQYYNPYVVALS